MEDKIKWGVALDDNGHRFLLGFNFNLGREYGYLCIYLGFKTLVIGKEYF